MATELKLPIGIESFKEVVSDCYYVDKTGLISEICRFPKESVLLFTRPRRFGKSLMLSTVDTFFNIKEKDAKSYFKGTKVYNDSNAMKEISSSPIIHLDMKEVTGLSFDESLSLLAEQIAKSVLLFKELLDDAKLLDVDRTFLNKAIERKLSKVELINSLNNLVRIVYEHYSLCPIVLIDEYDSPLVNAYEHAFYEEGTAFFKPFYSAALKGNHYLRFALLTGVNQIAKDSMFSGLNNIIVNSVLDSSFSEYFGFNEEEVNRLLEAYDLESEASKAKDWYDGYLFGKESIYNPWSILSFVANRGEAKEYWKMTGSNAYLRHLLKDGNDEVKNVLFALLNHEKVEEFIDFSSVSYSSSSKKAVLSLLTASGYLTSIESLGYGLYSLKIPNKKIQSIFVNEVLSLLPNETTLRSALSLRKSFIDGELTNIESALEGLFSSSFSYYDFSSEKNYQILLLAISSLLFDDAIVKSEVNEGYGRCDILIASKKGDFAFIIEVKAYKGVVSPTRLVNYSDNALKQIEEKKYAEPLLKEGYKNITLYGIAFSKSHVKIAKRSLTSSK